MAIPVRVEYAHQRKMRTHNTAGYRAAHWPIWIWVFFLAPGPLTFSLFDRGGGASNWIWLGIVVVLTGIAAFFGQLPGAEPAPYILRFDEDRPNPRYRRICYTFAWNALLNFALLNLGGSVDAVLTGRWHMKPIYQRYYFILLVIIVALGIFGLLPRVGNSTKGEGTERRYFYGAVWSVTFSQTLMLILWKTLPKNHLTDIVKLCAFVVSLAGFGIASMFGLLPRTRPILPGEAMVAD